MVDEKSGPRKSEGGKPDGRKSESKAPTPFDLYVAGRIRERRIELGISQPALADAIGVSFQQVQKYENGRNRIAASRLQAILGCLRVPPGYIYEGLPPSPHGGLGEAPGPAYVADERVSPAEGQELVTAFYGIGDATVRRHVLALVKSLREQPPPKPSRHRNSR